MREYRARSQHTFSNGDLMCTTACMCFGIAHLGGRIDPVSSDGKALVSSIDKTMHLANIGHGKVEKRIQQRIAAGTTRGNVCGVHFMVGAKVIPFNPIPVYPQIRPTLYLGIS